MKKHTKVLWQSLVLSSLLGASLLAAPQALAAEQTGAQPAAVETLAAETGSWGSSQWSLENGVLTIQAGEFTQAANLFSRPSWYSKKDEVTKIVFAGEVVANANSNYLFADLKNLTEIENLHLLKTANVTSAISIFSECAQLTNLDLSQFNMTNINAFGRATMFWNCQKLSAIKLGTNMTLVVTQALPGPDGADYSGKWYRVEEQKIFDSNLNFLANFNGATDAGEYRWQRAQANDIFFESNRGTSVTQQAKLDGELIDEPAAPARDGFDFMGWYSEPGLTTAYDFSKPVTEGVTLYAKWKSNRPEPVNHVVKFETAGGTRINSQSITEGLSVSRPADPEKAGYKFGGWYTDAALTQTYDFAQRVDSSFTLYAKWESEQPEPVKSQAMYRLYNPNSGEHFYTKDQGERSYLLTAGWEAEGIGWQAPEEGDEVYRLYNPNTGDHHYTLSKVEYDGLLLQGWRGEGVGWHSDPQKAVPVYRLYNPNSETAAHHYTLATSERDHLIGLGWLDEKIGWYGVKE